MQDNEFLTPVECAARLKVAPATLEAWRRHHRGPVHYKIGHQVRYASADVDAWLNARRGPTISHWQRALGATHTEVAVRDNAEAMQTIADSNARGETAILNYPDGNTVVWVPAVGSIWIEPGATASTIRTAPIDGPFIDIRRNQLQAAVEGALAHVTAKNAKA